MGIKEADRNTQETIRNDIFDESDKILDEFGVGDATNFQEDAESGGPLPAQLESSGENLARLQSAFERGALKESHYWGRMNSMVRQLRQRYPGYRPEIDQMVSGIVGGKPANELRNSLYNEWAAKSAETPLAKLEDWAVKNGTLPADYYDRQNSQNPYGQTELSAYVASKTRQAAEVSDKRAQIALSVDQGNVDKQNVEKAYRTESSDFVTTLIADTSGSIGQTYQVLQERIRDAQNQAALGKPMDVSETASALQQLEGDVMLALNQKFTESWDGDSNHSYVAQLSAEQKDAAIKQAMLPISVLKQAMTSDNPFGLMNAVTANNKARTDALTKDMISAVPVLEELQVMTNLAGPQVSGMLLQLGGAEGQSALLQSLTDFSTARAATRVANGTTASITDAYAKGVEANAPAGYYNGLIKKWQGVADQVTKGDVPLEFIQSNVQYMFGEQSQGILAAMDDNSKYEYYKKVSSPQVTAQMIKLKDMGDEDSWNTYQQWTTNAFMALFQQSVQDIQGLNADPAGTTVRWDPNSMGFVMKYNGVFNSGVGGYEAPMNNMNTAIRTISSIIKENGGDTEQEVYTLLTSMGYDPSVEKGSNLLQNMLASLTNSLGGSIMTPEEGAPSLNASK